MAVSLLSEPRDISLILATISLLTYRVNVMAAVKYARKNPGKVTVFSAYDTQGLTLIQLFLWIVCLLQGRQEIGKARESG